MVLLRDRVVRGLAPDTEYAWSVGPFDASSPNELDPQGFRHAGEWTFRTGAATSAPAASEAECRALAEAMDDVHCRGDTGDTGDTADTGDTGDTP